MKNSIATERSSNILRAAITCSILTWTLMSAVPTVIDFHTHLDERWFNQPLMDPATFLTGLDRCGVRAACAFTLMGFYEDCRRHNDLLLERCAATPERLWPFVTVDPKLGPAAVAELAGSISASGFS